MSREDPGRCSAWRVAGRSRRPHRRPRWRPPRPRKRRRLGAAQARRRARVAAARPRPRTCTSRSRSHPRDPAGWPRSRPRSRRPARRSTTTTSPRRSSPSASARRRRPCRPWSHRSSAHGLTPGAVSANSLSIPVTAHRRTLSSAFATSFSRVALADGTSAIANTAAPVARPGVVHLVQAVVGLDGLVARKPLFVRPSGSRKRAAEVARHSVRTSSPAARSRARRPSRPGPRSTRTRPTSSPRRTGSRASTAPATKAPGRRSRCRARARRPDRHRRLPGLLRDPRKRLLLTD